METFYLVLGVLGLMFCSTWALALQNPHSDAPFWLAWRWLKRKVRRER